MNIEEVDIYLDLWLTNKADKLWKKMSKLSLPEFAYVTAWITYMLTSENEISHKYDPPLPTSVIRDDCKSIYNTKTEYNNSLYPQGTNGKLYDPPLPTSIIKDENIFIRGKTLLI